MLSKKAFSKWAYASRNITWPNSNQKYLQQLLSLHTHTKQLVKSSQFDLYSPEAQITIMICTEYNILCPKTLDSKKLYPKNYFNKGKIFSIKYMQKQ